MKKQFIALTVALAWLLSSGISYASVGWKTSGGASDQQVTKVDSYGCTETFNGSTLTHDCRTISGTTATFTGDVIFQSSLYANGRYGASSTAASSSTGLLPANMPYSVLNKLVGGANSLDATPGTTLQNGVSGQTLQLNVIGIMPGGSWKVTPLSTASGGKTTTWTSMTFTAISQSCFMVYDSTIGWIAQANAAIVTYQTRLV